MTLKENARVKAQTIHQLSGGENCFSEDTGLEVDALGGEPGVHSARYAGEPVSQENNIRKLLRAMADSTNRRARFITVICLILEDTELFFEGRCEGQILRSPAGQAASGMILFFCLMDLLKVLLKWALKKKTFSVIGVKQPTCWLHI